jgi:AcrR family transcriptional regulator
MTSQRHSNRVDDATLLDAARSCVLAIGVGRTTLTEVARRAGVSRMTLYRRFPDARSLLTALMTREFGELLKAVADQVADAPTARARLVAGMVQGTRALVDNPVMRAVLDLEPELLLPYIVERIGGTQILAEQFLAEQVEAGHEDGSIRRCDVRTQVRALFLVVQSFVLSMLPATSDVDGKELLAELGRMLDGALEDR